MSLSIQRMIKAVELAAGQPGGLDYQQELEELYELRERMNQVDPEHVWQEQIEVVAVEAMCELMNMSTYDDYGKLARKNGGNVSREDYAMAVRNWHPTLTDSNLECGYDIINDLWSDNEAEGSHNADGTLVMGVI